ncbi:hypothetical protein FEV16_14265 [Methylocystis sp. B8]|nr:hypothetical protein FEV16_14265 [Methylocystis sp. B8]
MARPARRFQYAALFEQRTETVSGLFWDHGSAPGDQWRRSIGAALRLHLFTRWIADKEFEQLVLAIVRNLPLKEPSVLTVKGLRRILLVSGGVSARIFRMLNDVAIEAIETGVERITDEALERYKPVGEDEATFQ